MFTQKLNAGFKEILFWKLIYAVAFSIFFQIFCLVLFLFLVKLNLLNPLQWIKLTFISLTSFSTWLLLVPFATIIFIQGINYSKDYIFETTYRKSRFARYLAVFTLRNLFSFTSHILISVLTVWLYLTFLGGKYNSIYKPCKENHTCLVEETYFMFLNGVWIGLYYFIKEYLSNEKSIIFPVIQQKIFLTIKLTIWATLKKATREAIWPTIYFVILYYFRGLGTRDWLVETLNLQVDNEENTHVFNILGNNFIFAWLFSSLFIFSILCMKLCLEVFLTQHWIFPIESEFSTVSTLKEALVMNNVPILQYLACFDFYQLSLWDRARRQVLFSISQPGGHPHCWNKTLEAVLKIINEYSTELNRATDAILSPGSVTKVKETVKEEQPVKIQENIQEQIYFKSPVSSPIRNMTLSRHDSPVLAPVPQPELPNIFERIWDNMVHKIEQILIVFKKKSGIDYIFGEQPENRLYFVLSRSQPIIWVIQGLSFVITASFVEDNYGVVQKDLPVILTTLIQFKQNVDKLNKVNLSTRKNNRADCIKVQMRTALRTAVRRSLYNISNTFGEFLNQLPMSKDVLLQMQPFITYKEG